MKPGYLPRVLADRFGDAPAVRDEATEMSFRELDERVTAVAAQFREQGVNRGDVVAVMTRPARTSASCAAAEPEAAQG